MTARHRLLLPCVLMMISAGGALAQTGGSSVADSAGVATSAPAPRPTSPAVRMDPTPSAEPATVTVWNRPILVVRAPVGDRTPEQRARGMEARILELPDAALEQEITAVPGRIGDYAGTIVAVGNSMVLAILNEDIDPASGETMESVSAHAVQQLRAVLDARIAQERPQLILRSIGLSVAATVLFALIILAIVRLRYQALDRLQKTKFSRKLRAFGVNLRPMIRGLQRDIIGLVTWAAGIFFGYLWLTFVLSQFPYTKPWADRLGGYLLGILQRLALNALHAIPGLFTVAIIFFITQFVARTVDGIIRRVEMGIISVRWLEPDTAKATRRIASVIIWLFAVTVAYPYIPGSDSEAFKGVSVLAGLMISLGSAGFVNQIMSGFVAIYSRALRSGEIVQVGDTAGVVTEIGILSTKLRTHRREEVTIPNAVLVGSKLTNFSRLADEDGMAATTSLTIGYDAPWRQVHALLQIAADRTNGIRKEPAPFVLQRALSDFFVEYELRFRLVDPMKRFDVLSALHGQIQDAFNEFGVQIMSPHFESQPGQAVVVPKDQWHAAPATRVDSAAESEAGAGAAGARTAGARADRATPSP